MNPRSFLPLPGIATSGQPIKASDFNKLRETCIYLASLIQARTPQSSPDIGHHVSPGGFTSFIKRQPLPGGSAALCILGDLRSDPENEGKKIIRPGYISGGGGSEFLVKNNITPTIDQHLYVEVPWEANVEDDVILEGGTMGTPTISQGASIPSDVLPTVGSPSGTAYIPLGSWVSNGATPTPAPVWHHSGCGSISIKFCPGGGFYWIRGESYEPVDPYL